MKYWTICLLLILTRIQGSSGLEDFDGATKKHLCHTGELLCENENFKPGVNKRLREVIDFDAESLYDASNMENAQLNQMNILCNPRHVFVVEHDLSCGLYFTLSKAWKYMEPEATKQER